MSKISKNTENLELIVEKVNNSNISSIKQTVAQIINVINDPETSARDIEHIIELDPPLSTKLLRLSNSAYYNYPKKISSIREAIVLIGFNDVKELALSQKVCELFEHKFSYKGYSRPALWKHSVAVALCNKLIHRREFRESGENAYVAGLLHDIGLIIEDQFFQIEFKYILRESGKEKKNLYEVENTDIGFNHTDIGRLISENWNFPDMLVKAIGMHHNPEKVNDKSRQFCLSLFISDFSCQKKNLGYSDAPYYKDIIYKRYLRELNVKEKGMELILEEVEKEIRKMEKSGWFKNE